MKKSSLLAAAAVIALATPAFAAIDANVDVNTTTPAAAVDSHTKVETNAEHKSDGSVEEKRTSESSAKDAAGTETKEKAEVKVEENGKGDASKTVTNKSTVDPKGLMNEKTTETTLKEEVKSDGKHKIHRTKKVNGKTVVDENEESKPKAPENQ